MVTKQRTSYMSSLRTLSISKTRQNQNTTTLETERKVTESALGVHVL